MTVMEDAETQDHQNCSMLYRVLQLRTLQHTHYCCLSEETGAPRMRIPISCTNVHTSLHRLQVIVKYWSNYRFLQYASLTHSLW